MIYADHVALADRIARTETAVSESPETACGRFRLHALFEISIISV
jgi:hypothetical protein